MSSATASGPRKGPAPLAGKFVCWSYATPDGPKWSWACEDGGDACEGNYDTPEQAAALALAHLRECKGLS